MIAFTLLGAATFILVLVAAIASAVAATDIRESTNSTTENAKLANSYFIIAACLFFSAVAVGIVGILIGIFSGSYNAPEFSKQFLENENRTITDMENAHRGIEIFKSKRGGQITIIVLLFIILALNIVASIFATMGATRVSSILNQDEKTKSSMGNGILASITGWVSILTLGVSAVLYIIFREHNDRHQQDVQMWLDRPIDI